MIINTGLRPASLVLLSCCHPHTCSHEWRPVHGWPNLPLHFEGEDEANYEWDATGDCMYEDEEDHQDDIHKYSFKLTDLEPGHVPIKY